MIIVNSPTAIYYKEKLGLKQNVLLFLSTIISILKS